MTGAILSVRWIIVPTLAAFLFAANGTQSSFALRRIGDSDKPEVSVQTTHYEIEGSTVAELNAQMYLLGPVDKSGRHNHAFTDWNIRWTYTCKGSSDEIGVGSLEVKLKVKFTFPKWKDPPDADAVLVRKWNAYMKALQIHEDGHKDIGIEAANEVVQRVRDLGSYGSCQELGEAINSAGQAVLEQHRAKDRIYDRETNHGLTQGARLR